MMNKLVLTILSLAVIAGMVGVASAFTLDIWNGSAAPVGIASNPILIAPGETLSLSLHVEDAPFDTTSGNFVNIYLVPADSPSITGGPACNEITASYNNVSTDIIGTFFIPAALSFTQFDALILEATSLAEPGTQCNLFFNGQEFVIGVDSVDVNWGITVIPEFPTVALPIAGTIGVLFFLQKKKREEK